MLRSGHQGRGREEECAYLVGALQRRTDRRRRAKGAAARPRRRKERKVTRGGEPRGSEWQSEANREREKETDAAARPPIAAEVPREYGPRNH